MMNTSVMDIKYQNSKTARFACGSSGYPLSSARDLHLHILHILLNFCVPAAMQIYVPLMVGTFKVARDPRYMINDYIMV